MDLGSNKRSMTRSIPVPSLTRRGKAFNSNGCSRSEISRQQTLDGIGAIRSTSRRYVGAGQVRLMANKSGIIKFFPKASFLLFDTGEIPE